MKTALRITVLAIVLVALTGTFGAHADCPLQSDYVAPHTRTDFIKGGLVYDTTTNVLKTCDGTNWTAVAAGSGLSGGSSGYLGVWSGTTTMGLSGTTAGQNLFWDGTNHRLGIGTTSPAAKLNVVGASGIAVGATLTGDNAFTPAAAGVVLSGANQAGVSTYTSPGNSTTIGSLSYYADSSDSFKRYFDMAAMGSTGGATSNIRFLTGAGTASERMRIDGSGNVGVGTVSPAQKLTLSDGTSTVFLLEKTGGSAKNWYITNSAASAQTFGVSDETTYRLVITNVGNVGIGTTSPDRPLVVKASGGLGGAISVWPTTDSTEASIRLTTTAAGGGNTWYAGQGVWGAGAGNFAIGETANRLTILSGGNVGIGTTTPNNKLVVNEDIGATGSPGTSLAVGSTTVNSIITVGQSQTARASFLWNYNLAPANAYARLETIAGQPLILQSAGGNVGIGTTNPGRPLEVDGGDRQLRLRNFGTAPGKYWDIGPDGGNNFTLYNQGNAGAYISDGGTTWNAVSDARLKTDVRPLENNSGLEAMLKLRPVTFHWKSVASSKALQTGFIAQEVQRVLPDLVSAAPDADIASTNGNVTKIRSVLGINYTGLVVPIVKAVQELKSLHDSDIAKLEAANDNQAAEIEALRADIEALKKADH